MKKIKDEWNVILITRHTIHGSGLSTTSSALTIPGFTSQKLADEAAAEIKIQTNCFDVNRVIVVKVKEGN